jgi:cytochrome c biogenesis protein CcmG/thiol:disulfide interchange protein DsbE
MRRAAWVLLITIPLAWLLASGFGHDPNAIASPLVGRPAPDFALTTLDGKSFSLSHLRGRPVVVNFWASWCLTCSQEQSALVAAWQTYGDNVAFVGIDYEDTPSDARAFLQSYGGGWPMLRDPGQRTALNYGVYGVPETFFIDRHGVVRYKSTGTVTPAVLQTQIDRLLSAGS